MREPLTATSASSDVRIFWSPLSTPCQNSIVGPALRRPTERNHRGRRRHHRDPQGSRKNTRSTMRPAASSWTATSTRRWPTRRLRFLREHPRRGRRSAGRAGPAPESVFPGCTVKARVVGMYTMTDEGRRRRQTALRARRRRPLGPHPGRRRRQPVRAGRDQPLLRALQGPRAGQGSHPGGWVGRERPRRSSTRPSSASRPKATSQSASSAIRVNRYRRRGRQCPPRAVVDGEQRRRDTPQLHESGDVLVQQRTSDRRTANSVHDAKICAARSRADRIICAACASVLPAVALVGRGTPPRSANTPDRPDVPPGAKVRCHKGFRRRR